MRRPWQIGAAVALILALAFSAVAWLTVRALEAERAEALAAEWAAREELSRLALWRLDSTAASLLAEESGRPYRTGESDRAKTQSQSPADESEESAAHLLPENPLVKLYFWIDPRGEIRLAQERQLANSPATTDAKLAELRKAVTAEQLRAKVPLLAPPIVSNGVAALPNRADNTVAKVKSQAPKLFNQASEVDQSGLNRIDFQARAQLSSQTQLPTFTFPTAAVSEIAMTTLNPVWIDGQLLLARRVRLAQSERVEGCWLDWQKLEDRLRGIIGDLLPDARLRPADPTRLGSGAHLMAVLPISLQPGASLAPVERGVTPLRWALWATWGSLAVAATALGALLVGVVRLSERRAAFVSAVTHELRTPLTTFRMYAEMLAEGMIRDEPTRTDYLRSLGREADRLSHLVENVLRYARLERGDRPGRLAPLAANELVAQASERLTTHAAGAGMEFRIELPAELAARQVVADPTAVEQILFNLLDNACKYARAATNRAIELNVSAQGKWLLLAMVDHGPGVSVAERGRLFQAFRKSARDAAHSAPGVGLGLALSRRLAREMRGDLTLDANGPTAGARFVLWLPMRS